MPLVTLANVSLIDIHLAIPTFMLMGNLSSAVNLNTACCNLYRRRHITTIKYRVPKCFFLTRWGNLVSTHEVFLKETHYHIKVLTVKLQLFHYDVV